MTPTIEQSLHTKHFGRSKASDEEIAKLAHRYWRERQKNQQPGSDLEDWFRAETQLVRDREAAIDEASEESFPASDPPAH